MVLTIKLFVCFVAMMHLYFLWIEMFAWMTVGKNVFKSIPEDLFEKTKTMAANQGLYNGFLAAGLIWSCLIGDPIWTEKVALFFLSCVAIAGIYGGMSVSIRIFYIQAIPAIITLGILLLY